MDPDHPPTKKLRLSDSAQHDIPQSEQTLPVGVSSPVRRSHDDRRTLTDPKSVVEAVGGREQSKKPEFDGTMLSAVIGEDLSPEAISQLASVSGGDLERGMELERRCCPITDITLD